MTWKHSLLGALAGLLGIDLEATYQTVETEVKWKDPVEKLHELPDEDGRVYYWECATDEGAAQLDGILREYFVETLGREPRAAHIVLTDVEQLRRLDPEELKMYTQPFGNANGDGGER